MYSLDNLVHDFVQGLANRWAQEKQYFVAVEIVGKAHISALESYPTKHSAAC
ncbi:MAG: hypothetical protein KZQ61_09940 [Candidatus Thiodiazotropha sp. (ex Lucinoma aequizonata)]|nr:hypothetical protein [Candidatus Thiodiazotropha sp. (ex Lucinoma aequizonata)]